jgi:hypothetical protein
MHKQAIRKSPGRGTHIEGGFAANIDTEFPEGFFQLETASAHIARGCFNADCGTGIDQAAGLGDELIVNQNLAGKDFAPAFFSAADQLASDQQKI